MSVIPETGQLLGAAWRRDGSIVFAVWRGNLYAVPASGGQAVAILEIDPETEIDFHSPVELPDGRLIVAAHLLGNAPYRIEALDGDRRELVIAEEIDVQPVAFDNGHLLLWRGDVGQGIWALPYDGQLPVRMSDGFLVAPGAAPAATANAGTLLYLRRTDNPPSQRELVWVDRGGQVVAQAGPSRLDLFAPALSPDGARVAYSARVGDYHNVWVRDLRTELDTPVTSHPGNHTFPSWFPSGSHVAYSEFGGLGLDRMAVSEASGSGGRRDLGAGSRGVLSPDGGHVVYLIDAGGTNRVRTAPLGADGSMGLVRPLLAVEPEPVVIDFSFSRDGRLLAYTAAGPAGAVSEVFVAPFPDGDRRWQVSNGGGRSPRWSRDELFFVAGPGAGPWQIMAARVATGSGSPVGAPVPLFTLGESLYQPVTFATGRAPLAPRYDVTPDGARFLMTRAQSGAGEARRWVIVQNWRSEF